MLSRRGESVCIVGWILLSLLGIILTLSLSVYPHIHPWSDRVVTRQSAKLFKFGYLYSLDVNSHTNQDDVNALNNRIPAPLWAVMQFHTDEGGFSWLTLPYGVDDSLSTVVQNVNVSRDVAERELLTLLPPLDQVVNIYLDSQPQQPVQNYYTKVYLNAYTGSSVRNFLSDTRLHVNDTIPAPDSFVVSVYTPYEMTVSDYVILALSSVVLSVCIYYWLWRRKDEKKKPPPLAEQLEHGASSEFADSTGDAFPTIYPGDVDASVDDGDRGNSQLELQSISINDETDSRREGEEDMKEDRNQSQYSSGLLTERED